MVSKKVLFPVLSLAVVALALGLWSITQAVGDVEKIVVCVNKAGDMRMKGEIKCKKNEREVSWNVKGERGEKGEQGQAGINGVDGKDGTALHLFDGNNNDLGIFVGFADVSHSRLTYVPSIDGLAHFEIARSPSGENVEMKPQAGIFYLEQNCNGQAYVSDPYSPQQIVKVPGQSRFFKMSNEQPLANTKTKSLLGTGGCLNGENILNLFKVSEVALPFPYPVAWPLMVAEK